VLFEDRISDRHVISGRGLVV